MYARSIRSISCDRFDQSMSPSVFLILWAYVAFASSCSVGGGRFFAAMSLSVLASVTPPQMESLSISVSPVSSE